jgi:branched-chain amino acid transport system permease protein
LDPFIYFLQIVVFTGIYGILALSLNIEYGFTGLGNFGKVAFFLIGAYTYAILTEAGVHWSLCLIAGALMSGVIGSLIAWPALRLREDYLAISTLAFGEIIRTVVKAEDWIANGVWGITVPQAIIMEGVSFRVTMGTQVGLVFACLIICFIFVQLLTNSPYGRIMRAIREDDIAAATLGKNRLKYKAQVFFIGSAIAGVAGGLFAQYMGYIEPYMFMPMVTFTVWIMVLLGGPANNWGVLLGAALVTIFNRGAIIIKDYVTLPIDPNNLQYILLGILIILMLLYRPGGLLKESKIKTKASENVSRWKKHSSE